MGFPIGYPYFILPNLLLNMGCILGFLRRAAFWVLSSLGMPDFIDMDYCADVGAHFAFQSQEYVWSSENGVAALEFQGCEEVECAVCLSRVKRGQEIRVPKNCRHIFHRPCLDPWLQLHPQPTCPLCRSSFSTQKN